MASITPTQVHEPPACELWQQIHTQNEGAIYVCKKIPTINLHEVIKYFKKYVHGYLKGLYFNKKLDGWTHGHAHILMANQITWFLS